MGGLMGDGQSSCVFSRARLSLSFSFPALVVEGLLWGYLKMFLCREFLLYTNVNMKLQCSQSAELRALKLSASNDFVWQIAMAALEPGRPHKLQFTTN